MVEAKPDVSYPGAGIGAGRQLSQANESQASAVSWSAVCGGAFITAALSLILLALGTGLGFEAMSPWSGMEASASIVGASAVIWLILIQVISSSMGGYLAGRMRTKWTGIHSDEVYFRDTAHGFLAWAVALVVTAAFLASAAASMVGVGSQRVTGAERQISPAGYFVDEMFRADRGGQNPAGESVRTEAGRILAIDLQEGSLRSEDQEYLARLVDGMTGVGRAEAGQRVAAVFVRAEQSEDRIRRAIAHSLLWIFVALLIGAFCASLAATIGGRQRDHVISAI